MHREAEPIILILHYPKLTGGSGRPLRLRQWISLCTAPVQPLPANTTQSFSEAFSALRIINLI